MSTTPVPPDHQEDPDIVRVILDRVSVLVPEAQRAQLAEVEQQVRLQYGGLRVRIPKRKKHLTDEQRDAVARAARASDIETNEELVRQAGISRRSWYYMVKRRVDTSK